jgi:sugar/nucleoside kinase (ribokinase family)
MAQKTYAAIGIGACNLDTVAFVPRFTQKEEKISASRYFPPKPGGVALDAITMIAYLGTKCGFIGKRGDDALGKIFDEEMNADNVDMSRSIVVPGELTSLAWIQVLPNGDRCHVMIPMSRGGFLTVQEMQERRDYLQSARIVHMELLQMPVAALVAAARICKEAGTLVSVDLDIAPRDLYEFGYATPAELNELFSLTDILKAGKNAVAEIGDKDDLYGAATKLLEHGPEVVVITLGEEGCAVATRHAGRTGKHACQAFTDTGVVDTTGAGDAFQGGFLYGYLQEWPIDKCSILANACGYLKSLNVGARSMPSRATVEAFLKKKGWISL